MTTATAIDPPLQPLPPGLPLPHPHPLPRARYHYHSRRHHAATTTSTTTTTTTNTHTHPHSRPHTPTPPPPHTLTRVARGSCNDCVSNNSHATQMSQPLLFPPGPLSLFLSLSLLSPSVLFSPSPLSSCAYVCISGLFQSTRLCPIQIHALDRDSYVWTVRL